METDLLVVGGGIAGVTAAETFRKVDHSSKVLIVSEEDEPLYNRILLPYFIKGDKTQQQLYLRTKRDYESRNLGVVWGQRVIAGGKNEGKLSDGSTVSFQRLILAYSGDLRKLSGQGKVHYLRTIADAKRIKDLIVSSKKPVVVGDSFIALEFLGVLIKLGIPTTAIIAGEHFFSGKISPKSAAVLEHYLEDHKIAIIRNTKVSQSLGSPETFKSLQTEDGKQIEGDFCGAGIGLVFDLNLASQFGVQTGQGVITDGFLKAAANVWAAGDIAEFEDQMLNARHMLGNWVHAMESGRIAGANAAKNQDEPTPYRTISAYSTQTLGIPVAMAGDTTPNQDNKIMVEQTREGIAEIFVRERRTVGAVIINLPQLIGKVLLAIRARQPWGQSS